MSACIHITQRVWSEWPKALNQLRDAVRYAHATDVVMSGFERGWNANEAQLSQVEQFLSLADMLGVRVHPNIGKFTKYGEGAGWEHACYFPVKRNIDPVAKPLVETWSDKDKARPFIRSNGITEDRWLIDLDLRNYNQDYSDRFWEIKYKFTPVDLAGGPLRIDRMWYRSRANNPKGSNEGLVLTHQTFTLDDDNVLTIHVPSFETAFWTAYLRNVGPAAKLDSVTIAEYLPVADVHEELPMTEDREIYAPVQFRSIESGPPFLQCLSPNFDSDGQLNHICNVMDEVYTRFGLHPCLNSPFLEIDELHNGKVGLCYNNVAEAMADWTNRLARYAQKYCFDNAWAFSDMFEPTHNARRYVRACPPINNGCTNSISLLDPDLLIMVSWGNRTLEQMQGDADTLTERGFEYAAGIGNGLYQDIGADRWLQVVPKPTNLFYFNWGDQYYTPEQMSLIGRDWS